MKHKDIAKKNGFDSIEENFFFHWCNEAYENEIILQFEYSQKTFELAGKTFDTNGNFLMHPHVYTEDFLVYGINSLYAKPLKKFFRQVNDNEYHVDIKGTFNKYGGDKEFSINRKWVMQKHGIYINKIVPDKLFEKTWVPECVFKYTEKKKSFKKPKSIKKPYLEFGTVKQFIGTHKA